eukprot:CAMPEP_0184516876 /NCGR_PEP_ID=MMETSP0198_2-20121128/5261_1 /TAXON_ID=1112570 /ORGANISM="Thraustochytrium sp., Strain LLF1b" /LENGTH=557 /DNA_ID=CAMNT_0026907223 /DNA_START=287 /DNA_END=1960 /DNA_ORIENTATION=-
MEGAAPGSPPQGYMQVTVSDPIKHNEGMQSYITYKVTTKTDLERFESSHFYVHRRYSDFVWLQDQLAHAYPGLIIPPLPEKHVVRRFSEVFLAQRQRSLEKFLNRVAAHEQLRDNNVVKAFLELEALEATKATIARENKKNEKSFWDWASEATSTLSHKMSSQASHRPPIQGDEEFEDIKRYVGALEPQIAAVHTHSKALVEKEKETAQALFDFGLAFTLLGQAETDALGDAMTQLGHSADKLSRITAQEADKEAQFFDEPVKDYVRLVRQVKQTLDVRIAKEAEYENLVVELESKLAARDKQRATTGPDQASRLDAAEAEVRRVTKLVDDAKAEFELITQRVLTEMERFKREKLIDFKSIVLDYVQLQIEYNQQVEQSWRDVLPSLQALSVKGDFEADDMVSASSAQCETVQEHTARESSDAKASASGVWKASQGDEEHNQEDSNVANSDWRHDSAGFQEGERPQASDHDSKTLTQGKERVLSSTENNQDDVSSEAERDGFAGGELANNSPADEKELPKTDTLPSAQSTLPPQHPGADAAVAQQDQVEDDEDDEFV